MRICIDTNVLVQLFGLNSPFRAIQTALVDGRLELAVSTEILLEYEEVITRLGSVSRWQQVSRWLDLLALQHRSIIRIEPKFRFHVITNDPDDNKFIDCAVAAGADYVVTDDADFTALRNAGYKPQPITPIDLIARHLP
jgi:putative PIN family toxin of toxin-antitoxin system